MNMIEHYHFPPNAQDVTIARVLGAMQAAEVLNVSQPFLIKLLEEDKIPYRKVGKHHRIRVEDVMAYKIAIDQDREAVLDQLVAEAQEQDMGYGENVNL